MKLYHAIEKLLLVSGLFGLQDWRKLPYNIPNPRNLDRFSPCKKALIGSFLTGAVDFFVLHSLQLIKLG